MPQKQIRKQCNMNRVEQYLKDKLEEREKAGNLRRLSTLRAAADLYSNDYLGLATTGKLLSLMHPFPEGPHATGSTGSRLLSGNSEHAEQVEQRIAAFHKAEAALLFNSGYDANIGLLASVPSRDSVILSDELCHASIIDGIRLSLARHKYKFRHNDISDLETKLKKQGDAGPILVVVESVYSMDGDTAPLQEIAALCDQYGAQLIVDEAHATGIIGAHGEGLVCALGLHEKVFARLHTFGKALGCHGAAIVGSALLRNYLINHARSFIYTTALPDHSLHAIHCAYEYLSGHGFSNRSLHDLIGYFRSRIEGMPAWKQSETPIQAWIAGSNEKARMMAERLQQAGLQVSPVLHPTVPLDQERLRVCLHSFNTKEQVDLLVKLTSE